MTDKHFRRMVDGMKVAVVAVDGNLKAEYANPAFRTLFSSENARGSLGQLTSCAESAGGCFKCAAKKSCPLAGAFADALARDREISRRIYQRVTGGGFSHDVSYTITVTPVGGGLCMGSVDDAYELEIAREMQTAKSIQQRLLPAGKWVAGKKYSYLYVPCREIGGDLPDVYAVGGEACGMIADVSGKGVAAGMLSAFVKAAYDKTTTSPAAAIANLNAKFRELNLDERNYVTVAAVRIAEDSVVYSMAGHNVPILLKTEGGVTRIMLNSPPVSNWFDRAGWFDDSIPYKKGDILVLLTDGVTERRGAHGEMFGVDGAIKTLSYSKTADDFIKNLEAGLRAFSPAPLGDDVTAVAFDL